MGEWRFRRRAGKQEVKGEGRGFRCRPCVCGLWGAAFLCQVVCSPCSAGGSGSFCRSARGDGARGASVKASREPTCLRSSGERGRVPGVPAEPHEKAREANSAFP